MSAKSRFRRAFHRRPGPLPMEAVEGDAFPRGGSAEAAGTRSRVLAVNAARPAYERTGARRPSSTSASYVAPQMSGEPAGAGARVEPTARRSRSRSWQGSSCSPRTSPVPARRVRGAGLASPVERRRAAAAVARGDVRRVTRRGADVDAGEQTGAASRTVSPRGAPAMTAHAGAPGLVRCIADRASAAAPAGTRHRAGLAGAVAAAATVAN